MRKIFIIFSLCLANTIQSQDTYKFRLLLTDKEGSEYSVERPEEFLSERALARRAKYAIPIDITDLPVSKTYLNLLLQQPGITLVNQSKWMNSVVISCNDSLSGVHLKNLPFVDSVKVVWKRKAGSRSEDAGQKHVITNVVVQSAKTNPNNKHGTGQWIASFLAMTGAQHGWIPQVSPRLETRGSVTETLSFSGIMAVDNAANVDSGNDDDYYGRADNQIKLHNGDWLHGAGYKGAGIMIAVIDAGFKNANNIQGLNQSIIGDKDFVMPGGNVYAGDMSNHGTMVLATMAANIPGTMVGTAPEATYWLLRSEDISSEYPVEEDYWAAAAEFADSVGVDVMNTSLGYSDFDFPAMSYTKNQLDGKTAFISQASHIAAQKGILACVSAGNSGAGAWRLINFPGDAENVLTVGSVNKDGVIAPSSSVGPTADQRIKPNLTAMGVSACVLNESGDVAFSSGTSFASPIMAGLGACLLQAFPNYSNTDIIRLLEKSASQSDMPDYDYGYGIADVYKAYLTGKSSVERMSDKTPVLFVSPFGMLSVCNLPGSTEKYTVTVHNACGELLCKKIPAGGSIDVSSLQQGVYLVTVQGGGVVHSCKIVK